MVSRNVEFQTVHLLHLYTKRPHVEKALESNLCNIDILLLKLLFLLTALPYMYNYSNTLTDV